MMPFNEFKAFVERLNARFSVCSGWSREEAIDVVYDEYLKVIETILTRLDPTTHKYRSHIVEETKDAPLDT
jgi:hypothetical protein